MSTIVTRSGKGSPLTHTEVDSNFTNLNTDKIQVTGSPSTNQSLRWDGSAYVPYTPTEGTVTSVTGTSPVASSGGATPAISLATAYGDTQNPYGSKTANFVLAAPNGSAGVPTFRAIVAADVPTLNQNTTGTAGNVTGTVAIINGGTGATTAGSAVTNLGASTLGSNLFTVANPSAVTFPRFNADNTVSSLNDSDFRTAIGAGTSSTTGTVTSITAGTGLSGGLITTSGTIAIDSTVATLTGTQTLTNKTVTNLVFDGSFTEEVFTITDAAGVEINPANGTIQHWTLGANRTPTATNFASGQSVTLLIDDGSAFTITWTTIGVVFVGGTAPTLATTGKTVIELFKVSTVVYGALVGNVA